MSLSQLFDFVIIAHKKVNKCGPQPIKSHNRQRGGCDLVDVDCELILNQRLDTSS